MNGFTSFLVNGMAFACYRHFHFLKWLISFSSTLYSAFVHGRGMEKGHIESVSNFSRQIFQEKSLREASSCHSSNGRDGAIA
jgi:hypothetical protein